jgi:hypothetical protein
MSAPPHRLDTRRCAKLLWNGVWILRYPGPNGECLKLRLRSREYADAYDEANRLLCHEPQTEWIIA